MTQKYFLPLRMLIVYFFRLSDAMDMVEFMMKCCYGDGGSDDDGDSNGDGERK